MKKQFPAKNMFIAINVIGNSKTSNINFVGNVELLKIDYNQIILLIF